MKKYKVNIVIPIYNSLDWLKLCITSIFLNTNLSILNKVYLIDDGSNKETKEYIKSVKEKYGDFIETIFNKKNLGFVKNSNNGLKLSISDNVDYVLLLNSDCILSKNAIEKMANAMQKNKKIGLLCPISSIAANLSYPIPSGMDFMQVNEAFEHQFSGKTFDACTVVGNCLMISKDCIEKTGYLDEIFEKGYTEETDYQFKAMQKGFEAKVLIDTYVYHQGRASFGESKNQLEIRQKHLNIFFERWGDQYYPLLEKYSKNNPIDYIKNNIKYDNIVYNDQIKIRNLKDLEIKAPIINRMILDGININVICKEKVANNYDGKMLFNVSRRGFNLF